MESDSTTPQQSRVTAPKYAGFWVRFIAWVIDVAILTVIFAILSIPLSGSPLLARGVTWFITYGYLFYFWTTRGQTPGKIVAGARIVRIDGKPLSADRALLRCAGFMIYWLPMALTFQMPLPLLLLWSLILPALLVWIAFDLRKQGLHDKLAGTMVIRVRPYRMK